MNKKEKRIVAGQVCNYIGREFRAVDCPNAEAILNLHSVLQKDHGYTLLGKISATSKGIACMAAKAIFILEKITAGYPLARIPDCLSQRKEFINQYFNLRTKRLSGYRIKHGPIAKAHSVKDAIHGLSSGLSKTSTMAPC